MKAKIDVSRAESGRVFRVTVHEAGGRTTHEVTVREDTHRRLAEASEPEQLIEAAFRFLLDREPKESILHRFDLMVISHYFGDFEERISDYLAFDAD